MSTATSSLRALFERGGYIRRPDLERLDELGSQQYKKGFEVRLVLHTQTEVRQTKRWLKEVGLGSGNPFAKHTRIILPIYGQAAVDWFERTLRKSRR